MFFEKNALNVHHDRRTKKRVLLFRLRNFHAKFEPNWRNFDFDPTGLTWKRLVCIILLNILIELLKRIFYIANVKSYVFFGQKIKIKNKK